MKTDPIFVHPEEAGNMQYWSRKFGVSDRQLLDAIMQTGSLRASVLREKLQEESWLHHPLRESMKALRNTINFIF
jgi:hypothetical protein